MSTKIARTSRVLVLAWAIALLLVVGGALVVSAHDDGTVHTEPLPQVAPAGEPILLNAPMQGRFANTFLHVGRPAEIDRGGHVRGNVHGDPTEPDKAGRTDVFNYSLDGWVTLAVADATVYRLCRDVLLRTSGPRLGQPGLFQEYLGIGTHAALLANKR